MPIGTHTKDSCTGGSRGILDGSFEQRLALGFDTLSEKLRRAGEYVADNPVDVATRSLRTIAQDSGLAPATFSRMARALEYDSFEDVRDSLRSKIGRRVNSFSERIERLQNEHATGSSPFYQSHFSACRSNIGQMAQDMDVDQLEQAVDKLHKARNVQLLGALGSTGVVEYLSYMANFCTDNWSMASRMGASLGTGLTGLDARDALLIVTKPPFSARSIAAAEMAAKQGAYVVVITDTHSCPALRHADSGFVIPTDGPHFYSSYVATIAFVEVLIGMVAGRMGVKARDRIEKVEESNRQLGEVWDA